MEAGESPLDTGQTSAAAASLVVAPPAIAPEGDAEPEEEEHGESSPCSADVLPKKRKGKSTRWNIPKHALTTLEQVFTRDKFPTVDTRNNLATELKVTPRQVQVWFQNKRQRSLKPPVKASSTEQQPPQTPPGRRGYPTTQFCRRLNISGGSNGRDEGDATTR